MSQSHFCRPKHTQSRMFSPLGHGTFSPTRRAGRHELVPRAAPEPRYDRFPPNWRRPQGVRRSRGRPTRRLRNRRPLDGRGRRVRRRGLAGEPRPGLSPHIHRRSKVAPPRSSRRLQSDHSHCPPDTWCDPALRRMSPSYFSLSDVARPQCRRSPVIGSIPFFHVYNPGVQRGFPSGSLPSHDGPRR